MPNLQIDWAFIEQSELKEGQNPLTFVHPSMNSGLTLGAGIDLKKKNVKYLKDMGVPPDIINKLKPYLGQTGEQARKTFLNLKDVEILTQPELDVLYSKVKEQFGKEISTSYRRITNKRFTDLDPKSQTALADIGWHEGSSLTRKGAVDPTTGEHEKIPMNFVSQIANNDMTAASANLKDWNEGKKDDFVERHLRVRDYLKGDVSQGVIDKGIGTIADTVPFAKDFAVGVGDALDTISDPDTYTELLNSLSDKALDAYLSTRTFRDPETDEELTIEETDLPPSPSVEEKWDFITRGLGITTNIALESLRDNDMFNLDLEVEGTRSKEEILQGLDVDENGDPILIESPDRELTDMEAYQQTEQKKPGALLDIITEPYHDSWDGSDIFQKRLTHKDYDKISDEVKGEQLDNYKGYWSGVGAGIRHNWGSTYGNLERILEDNLKFDPNFDLTKEKLDTYMQGLPVEWEDEFIDAHSDASMLIIRDRLLKQQERAAEIAALGVPAALAVNLGTFMSDPIIWTGMGVISKLLGVPKMARIIEGNVKALRLTEMAKSAASVSGGVGLSESFLAKYRADIDAEDVMHTMLVAGAIGSLFGIGRAARFRKLGDRERLEYPEGSKAGKFEVERLAASEYLDDLTKTSVYKNATFQSTGKLAKGKPSIDLLKKINDWKKLSKAQGELVFDKGVGKWVGQLKNGRLHGKGKLTLKVPNSYITTPSKKGEPRIVQEDAPTTTLTIHGKFKNGKFVKALSHNTDGVTTDAVGNVIETINDMDKAVDFTKKGGSAAFGKLLSGAFRNIIRQENHELAIRAGHKVLTPEGQIKVKAFLNSPKVAPLIKKVQDLEIKLNKAGTQKEISRLTDELTVTKEAYLHEARNFKITKNDIKPIAKDGVGQLSDKGEIVSHKTRYTFNNTLLTPDGQWKPGVISKNSEGDTLINEQRLNILTGKYEKRTYVVAIKRAVSKDFIKAVSKLKAKVALLTKGITSRETKLTMFGTHKLDDLTVAYSTRGKNIRQVKNEIAILKADRTKIEDHLKVKQDEQINHKLRNGDFVVRLCNK